MKKIITLLIVLLVCQGTFSQNYKFGKVSKEELEQKVHPREPTANAAILYRENDTRFEYNEDSGFFLIQNIFERIKIYNKEGFEWATKIVNLYQGTGGGDDQVIGLKANTYYLGPDGKIVEVKLRNDGIFEEKTSKYLEQYKFTMPDLREGCVLEFKYTFRSPFIGNVDEFRFQEQIPVDKVDVTFSAPEYFFYETHQKGWVPYRINKEYRDRTMSYRYTTQASREQAIPKTTNQDITFKENIYKIELSNVPALKEEALAGNIDNYSTALKLELSYTKFPNSGIDTYSTTWEAVSKTIYNVDSFGGELDRTNYFEEDMKTLLQGISNPEEKMMRIYEFAKTKMNWNGYHSIYANEGVKDAYKKGSGNVADINLMLVSMFRSAGLTANPVLISTKDHGIPIFPTRNGFNYVVAAVENNNKILLFDATNKMGEPNILQTYLLNWQGRLIRKDRSSTWVPLTPSEAAVRSTMLTGTVSEDLSVKGESQNRFAGHYALLYRNNYLNKSEEDSRKKLEEENGQIDINGLKFENLKDTNQPVTLKYNFDANDAIENIGGKLYFSPLLFLTTKENPFKLEERQYPVDYGFPLKDRYIVTIGIPEGYKVESIPESSAIAFGENMGAFRYTVSQNGNKVQVSMEFSINESLIGAQEYPNLKKFYELLIEKEKEKVVLVKV